MWFTSKHVSGVEWKPDMTPEEAARVIERFVDGPGDSIEWCDFAERGKKIRELKLTGNAATN
jgi:hypothetical protein